MNLHEYQGKEILNSFGVRIQRGIVASNPKEAVDAAKQLTDDTGTSWSTLRLLVMSSDRVTHWGFGPFAGAVSVVLRWIQAKYFGSKGRPDQPDDWRAVHCVPFDFLLENISTILTSDCRG